MKRIAILGGGIAGLTAAYELALQQNAGADLEVTLFESSSRLGGIIETVHADRFTIDCGPDAWVTEKPWLRDLAEELGLAHEIIHSNDATRKTYILQQGKLIPIPDGMRMMVPATPDALAAIESSPLFTAAAKAACHAELTRAAELKSSTPSTDESIANFVRRHFGDEMLEKIAAPLLSGVFGGNVETLGARAVMPAFVQMEREHGSLIAALQSRTAKPQPIFTTLRSGLETILTQLIAKLPAHWIRLNTPAASITRTASTWLVNNHPFDSILLATPAHITRQLLQPIDARAAALLEIEASSAVVVALAFTENFPLPQGFGFLVPQSEHAESTQLLAATFTDQKFPHRVPPNARLLRAFFGSQTAERIAALDDTAIATLAHCELQTILGALPQPKFTVIRRWPRSLPQYAVGHLDRMAELDTRIRALPSLHLIGNAYRGVGLPDIARDARQAARASAQS